LYVISLIQNTILYHFREFIMSTRLWTKEELNYLRRSYPKLGAIHTSEYLKRSIGSVVAKAITLGITRNGFRHWESYEDNYIKRHYNNRKRESIARTLKRSKDAVLKRAIHLGVTSTRAKKWTEEEKNFLRENYSNLAISLEEIAKKLGRSLTAIYNCAKHIDIHRPQNEHEWTKEERKYLVASYKKKRFIDIAVDLGLSRNAVESYANRNGIRRKPPIRLWTENDLNYVRQHYASDTAEAIGANLGRTVQSIRQCAGRMGLQSKQNWHKPANIEARIGKFKTSRFQKLNKNR